MSRELGNGRWDRVLKARMVELSEADNYDDAKEEWEATGKVWWGGLHHNSYDDITTIPEWVSKHPRECLCGHKIVYHYEIHNTKNGIRECVGSDHINSYLILKSISESTGIAIADITDAMIEEWINVRVKGMMAEAWWAVNGDNFIMMFDAVKEVDLRVNVNTKGNYFDRTYQMMRPNTSIRKKGTRDGGIASIVWRWNHPDNAKAQINTRGYPNALLEADLVSFYIRLSRNSALVSKEDTMLEKILAAETIRKEIGSGHKKLKVEAMLEYYGLTNFYEFREGVDSWARSFMRDIELRLGNGRELSPNQLAKLGEILTPATEKQFDYLRALGYEGTTPLSKRQATQEIDKIKRA